MCRRPVDSVFRETAMIIELYLLNGRFLFIFEAHKRRQDAYALFAGLRDA